MSGQQAVAMAFVILLGVSTFMMFEVRDELRGLKQEIQVLRQLH